MFFENTHNKTQGHVYKVGCLNYIKRQTWKCTGLEVLILKESMNVWKTQEGADKSFDCFGIYCKLSKMFLHRITTKFILHIIVNLFPAISQKKIWKHRFLITNIKNNSVCVHYWSLYYWNKFKLTNINEASCLDVQERVKGLSFCGDLPDMPIHHYFRGKVKDVYPYNSLMKN